MGPGAVCQGPRGGCYSPQTVAQLTAAASFVISPGEQAPLLERGWWRSVAMRKS